MKYGILNENLTSISLQILETKLKKITLIRSTFMCQKGKDTYAEPQMGARHFKTHVFFSIQHILYLVREREKRRRLKGSVTEKYNHPNKKLF